MMLTSALAACSDAPSEDTAQDTSAADTTTVVTEPPVTEKVYIRDIRKFDGKAFNVVADLEPGNGLDYVDLTIAEENGEALNDAIYKRNLRVTEEHGVKLSSICVTDSETQMVNAVSAGDHSYDAAALRLTEAYKYTTYCTDLMKLDSLNLGESWWDKNIVNSLSIAGSLKMIAGDIFYKHYNGVYMMLFNKKMYADLGLEDPYKLVRDGKWTVDKFGELAAKATQDLNGDGTMDRYDRYGFASQAAGFAMSLINGSDMTIISKDKNDIPYATVDVDKLTSLFAKYDPTYTKHTYDATRDANNANESAFWVFPEGRSLFFFALPNYITWKLRDVNFDYGILPIPKYDEAQAEYCSAVASWHSYVYMIPKSAASAEDSAYIMDVLAFWGEEYIKPAYYDITLQRKLSKDAESAEMLDIIFDNMIYDLGYYAKFGGFYTTFSNAASRGEDMNFASMYASCKTKIDQDIADYVKAVSEE